MGGAKCKIKIDFDFDFALFSALPCLTEVQNVFDFALCTLDGQPGAK